jgi:EAL domain-containing protein (putative c-di-GMP-specific phosphodiesterase class I)/FixJ family two-component response regulator
MMASQKILVIDDDIEVGALVHEAAQAMEIACKVTTNANSFMEALTPDTTLIFLDLVMPGIDGIEILRKLAHKECRAGIVMMSGIGKRVIESAGTLGQSLGLHIVGHLAKPFRMAELEAMLSTQVEPRQIPPAEQNPEIYIDEAELLQAVVRDEFVMHYQPQIEIATGRVVGVEGLVRWEHPQHGLIFPGSFIENAEDIGLIDQLTLLVFHHGLSEFGLFDKDESQPLTLSLNVSASSLRDLHFPNRFIDQVQAYGVLPEKMILEITESRLINEYSRTMDVLTRLRIKKVQLSIDDFGVGYSMLQQLRNIPATEMKIDQSIVQNTSPDNRIILQKTIELGHELGMNVIAEGVETQEQLDFLRSQGCDSAQGYLFCRPLPCLKLIGWLDDYRKT